MPAVQRRAIGSTIDQLAQANVKTDFTMAIELLHGSMHAAIDAPRSMKIGNTVSPWLTRKRDHTGGNHLKRDEGPEPGAHSERSVFTPRDGRPFGWSNSEHTPESSRHSSVLAALNTRARKASERLTCRAKLITRTFPKWASRYLRMRFTRRCDVLCARHRANFPLAAICWYFCWHLTDQHITKILKSIKKIY